MLYFASFQSKNLQDQFCQTCNARFLSVYMYVFIQMNNFPSFLPAANVSECKVDTISFSSLISDKSPSDKSHLLLWGEAFFDTNSPQFTKPITGYSKVCIGGGFGGGWADRVVEKKSGRWSQDLYLCPAWLYSIQHATLPSSLHSQALKVFPVIDHRCGISPASLPLLHSFRHCPNLSSCWTSIFRRSARPLENGNLARSSDSFFFFLAGENINHLPETHNNNICVFQLATLHINGLH